MVQQARRTLALILLQGFEHTSDRNDYEIFTCGGDGCVLLRQLDAETDSIGLSECNNIINAMSHIFMTGLASPRRSPISRAFAPRLYVSS